MTSATRRCCIALSAARHRRGCEFRRLHRRAEWVPSRCATISTTRSRPAPWSKPAWRRVSSSWSLLLHRHRLQHGPAAAAHGRRDGPDQSLCALQADDRMDARGHREGAQIPSDRAALFQCRRRRSEGPYRPDVTQRNASDQGRVAGGTGTPAASELYGTDYPTRTAPASAITSTSPI